MGLDQHSGIGQQRPQTIQLKQLSSLWRIALTHWSEAVVRVFSPHYMNWLLGCLVWGLDISGVFI